MRHTKGKGKGNEEILLAKSAAFLALRLYTQELKPCVWRYSLKFIQEQMGRLEHPDGLTARSADALHILTY